MRMRRALLTLTAGLLAACALAWTGTAGAAPPRAKHKAATPLLQNAEEIRFGVLTRRPGTMDEGALQDALNKAGENNYAVLLAIGVKAPQEDCEDSLYSRRKAVLNQARVPLVLAPAGSDWTECRSRKGRPNAVDRLNRLRETFFADSATLGKEKIEINRLSEIAKFRSYAEYAHWQVGRVLFASINLPAPNNNYRTDAGRNSEFEDRAIANRDWIARLFRIARLKKLDGIVLFSDADLFAAPDRDKLRELGGARDGLQDLRKQLAGAMQQYGGRVLLIDAQPAPNADNKTADGAIAWRGKLGHLNAFAHPASNADILTITILPATPELFAVRPEDRASERQDRQ